MTVEADQRYIVDVVNYQLVVRFLGKSNLIDSPFSAEYRDVFFVAVCAANPEIRPFVFPAVSASFLCDACAVDGFGLHVGAWPPLLLYYISRTFDCYNYGHIIILRTYVCVIQTGNRHCR